MRALVASLLLHLAMLGAPGWEMFAVTDARRVAALDATLAIPVRLAPAPAQPVVRKTIKRPARKAVVPLPAPQASPSPIPGEDAPQQAVPEPTPEAPGEWPLLGEAGVGAESPAADAPAPEVESFGAVLPEPSFSPYAEVLPRSGRLLFQVTRGEDGFIVGRSEHRWEHDGNRYALRSFTETIGLAALFKPATVVQESLGLFSATGLKPQEFRNERSGKPVEIARFDAAECRVHFSNGQSAACTEGAQDMLSLFYQVGALDLGSERLVLEVATGRKLARYLMSVGAMVALETPLGSRSAHELRMTPVQGGGLDDSIEIWLDTAWRLPLRIRYRDRRGEVFDQLLMEMQTE